MATIASRKRSHSIDPEPVVHKKPNLSTELHHVNGTPTESGGESKDLASGILETFRKEAIYRKMKHYSRENDRNHARIAELERRKRTCEEGLAAMSACWAQLLETMKVLIAPEELQPIDPVITRVLDMTQHLSSDEPSEFKSQIQQNVGVTENLIARFVQLGKSNAQVVRAPEFAECQSAKNECTVLRTEMRQMRSRLVDVEAWNSELHAKLVTAESRVDRLQSRSVSLIEGKKMDTKEDDINMDEPKAINTDDSPKQLSNGHVKDAPHSDIETIKALAEARYKQMLSLQTDVSRLRDENLRLELEAKSVSNEIIEASPQYKALLEFASKLETAAKGESEVVSSLEHELATLKAARQEAEALQKCTELDNALAKKDADLTRIREQRERLQAETNERKARDQVKITSTHDYKVLCESQTERIRLLEQEVARLKSRLAADTGNEDLLYFLLGQHAGQNTDISFHDHLQNRLLEAENRASSLEQTLSLLQDSSPDVAEHMQSEARARQELARVQAMLNKYQSVYGETSTLPPDVSSLATELKSKTDEISALRLREVEHTQTESGLYTELEKLSAAWESLDKQLKSRVDQLRVLEDKAKQCQQERAKAENKFYAAMKEKDAALAEVKNAARTADKHAKVLEKLTSVNNSLEKQLADLERDKGHNIRLRQKLESENLTLQGQLGSSKAQLENATKRLSELLSPAHELKKSMEEQEAKVRSKEEELIRQRKDMERQHANNLKQLTNGNSDKVSERLREEIDKLNTILKCSTCQQAYRKMVITKCMHTFCKQCIESRVASRQRKCPHCSLSFAQSEVQQIFFQ